MSQQPPQNGVSSSKRFPPAKTTNSTNTTAPSPRTSFETNNNGVPTTTVTAPSTPTHNSIAKKTGTKTSKSIDETMLKHVESSSSVDEGTAPKMTTSSTGIPKGKYASSSNPPKSSKRHSQKDYDDSSEASRELTATLRAMSMQSSPRSEATILAQLSSSSAPPIPSLSRNGQRKSIEASGSSSGRTSARSRISPRYGEVLREGGGDEDEDGEAARSDGLDSPKVSRRSDKNGSNLAPSTSNGSVVKKSPRLNTGSDDQKGKVTGELKVKRVGENDTLLYKPSMIKSASEMALTSAAEFEPEEDASIVQKNGILTYDRPSDKKKMIYGGTAEKIVEVLLDWLVTDPNRNDIFRLVHIFIINHPKYIESIDLVEMLITFVMFFLSAWFEIQYSDFLKNVGALSVLETFMKDMPTEYQKPLVSKIQNALKPRPAPEIYLFEASKESKKRNLEPGKFGFADLKPEQVANHWTVLDMKNILQIQRSEFIFTEPEKCPAWENMLQRSALFTRWVASEIVQHINLNERVEIMKKFVEVALFFLENNNFNGLMCTWGGLNTVSVHRLKKTKKKLPRKTLDIWQALEEKLHEANNFLGIRKVTKKKVSNGDATVPWFELINKMRNWADQYDDFITPPPSPLSSSPSTPHRPPSSSLSPSPSPSPRSSPSLLKKSPILNFSKMYLLGEQIFSFEQFQKLIEKIDLENLDGGDSGAKNIVGGGDGGGVGANNVDFMIRSYLEHLPTYSDEVLWKFSLQCEPAVNNS